MTIIITPSLLAIGRDWWLPANYALHGRQTDALFQWFFWITLSILIVIQSLLVIFVLKFRRRPGHTLARYLPGNIRLELLWTFITASIIGALAYGSERVWRDYRSSPDLQNPSRSKILVIGQQFKWNVIYPGPDGKFGRYLLYPKPTDPTWPPGPDGKTQRFANVPGPASLAYKDAVQAIDLYIDTRNPLGKDFSDPDGKDDDWSFAPGRPIYVPVNRPVEVELQSKDVIHDFFIPNFRAQLYAVPGMRGRFVFTPTITTRDIESPSRQSVSIDQLQNILLDPANADLAIDIAPNSPHAILDQIGWQYVELIIAAAPVTIIRDQMKFSPDTPDRLRHAGITQVTVHKSQPFEVACAQLCGAQHYTMRNELIVLSQEEFDKRFPAAPHAK
jgi:heme/copper-type cytochrome/quinol oxidase subunit 2